MTLDKLLMKSPLAKRILNQNNLRYEPNTQSWKYANEENMGKLTRISSIKDSYLTKTNSSKSALTLSNNLGANSSLNTSAINMK